MQWTWMRDHFGGESGPVCGDSLWKIGLADGSGIGEWIVWSALYTDAPTSREG